MVQIGDGQQAPAPAVHRRSMHVLDVLLPRISLQPDQFEQTDLGNDESLAAAGDHQPGMMASVRGILILIVVPSPARLNTSTTPPIFSMLDFTTSMPTPAAGNVGHRLRRREAGLKDQVQGLAIAQLSGLFRRAAAPSRRPFA